MSLISPRLIPSDVREAIDRADGRFMDVVERLSVIADQLSEQNMLLREQNKMMQKKLG